MIKNLTFRSLTVAALMLVSRAEERSGEVIYRDMCADCHGADGGGVAGKYDEPLYGERGIPSLAKLIDQTMPEDKEETLDAAGAALVAEYVHRTFYSPAARARLHPPRLELAHLTNRQYRESVADLLAGFVESFPPGDGTGIMGSYFESEGMNKKAKAKLERLDAGLDFDFGDGPPVEGCSAGQFSIAWQGSFSAGDTGYYDFRLTTPNGARFYLNRDVQPGDRNARDDSDGRRQPALIDEWVSSGDAVRETAARVWLQGGRHYPVRLDYFKYKEKLGRIRLEFKPPHGVWQVMKAPHLSPQSAARLAVVTTPFPPDDASLGYERGTAVSKSWYEAVTRAALETAGEVELRMRLLVKARPEDADFTEKAKAFGRRFAERAFRRPLTAEEQERYVDRHFAAGVAPAAALKRVVILVLESPYFLYPGQGLLTGDYAVASRLALVLWDSLPDAPLLDAAAKGELKTPDQCRAHAVRMMADPKTKAKWREFFHRWLAFDKADDLSKDGTAYPGFTEAVVADLRESLERFIEEVVWSGPSDFRQLLTADYLMINPRLAAFYGVTPPAEDRFEKVAFDPSQRAGVLTHPYLLAALAYHKSSSPIHRGVFLTRNVLGRFLKPPPMAIAFMDDKFDPGMTMREKVTELTKGANCMACHQVINPLGFSLENFDAVGRWRTVDQNKPVQAASSYTTVDGDEVPFRGPRDVANHALESPGAQLGFVRQLFQFAVKQAPAACGPETLEQLHAGFVKSGFHMRGLLVEIAVTAAAACGPSGAVK